jgi:hypothetical protein
MANESKCLKCGAPLTPDARDSVCPKCLLALALASESGEASSDAAPWPPVITEEPGAIIGRYKLLEKIGEGGFGMVYVAEQEEPVRRRVALKIIKRRQLELQGWVVGPNDLQIAAIARAHGLALVSADQGFGHVPGLVLEDWTPI